MTRRSGGTVPLRRSLLLRLLAGSAVIALCSIASTAWLVMRGTTRAIEAQQVHAYANDSRIYDALVGYAATHASWADAQSFVAGLTAGTDRRITLTTPDRKVLLGDPVTGPPAASVDALHVDPALLPDAQDQIDERAAGPYTLTEAERADQATAAAQAGECLRRYGYTSVPVAYPGGMILVHTTAPPARQADCDVDTPPLTLGTKVALDQLSGLTSDCLHARGSSAVTVAEPITWRYETAGKPDPSGVHTCLVAALRQQLAPYVAPAALLFIHSGDAAPARAGGFQLSSQNLARTLGVAALVLAVTIAVTAVAGARLVRPLRALTAAAAHPTGARIPVTGRDEIGALAAVLNHVSARRQEAEDQRRAMVSDIAHELRTPLATIRGWLEAAEDGLADPVTDPELTSALLAQALHLQRIVDDLQDLASADAGTLRLRREPVDVADLVHRVATARRAGNLVENTEPGCVVDADPDRLTQALGNLLDNALRYTPSSGTVTVAAAREPDGVRLSVADTGPGIAPEDLPHVFDRFWRADPSRTRDTGGSGLGLAIVKHLVEAHAGTVEATSDGTGTTFTIHLPVSAGT